VETQPDGRTNLKKIEEIKIQTKGFNQTDADVAFYRCCKDEVRRHINPSKDNSMVLNSNPAN
jgi:hypothetical protein